jgi:hypothetical protein
VDLDNYYCSPDTLRSVADYVDAINRLFAHERLEDLKKISEKGRTNLVGKKSL